MPGALADALHDLPEGSVCVGFSGGLDSTVLLHLLAHRGARVRAVHVDHGLQANAGEWAEHCREVCARWGVAFVLRRVQVESIGELGPEGAARAARHAAFADALDVGETLALAHHRDDQAETVLLRLLHGAGTEGLAGMRRWRPFARGQLWRPLLGHSREELLTHARAHGLSWIEDPTNACPEHAARNHLRHAVLPALRARWPDAVRRIAGSAARVQGEAELLDTLAGHALAAATHDGNLLVPRLGALAPALRRVVVGRWLDAHGLPRPPPGAWREFDALLAARADAAPLWRWRGAEVRRHRDALHAMRPLPPPTPGWERTWDGHAPLALPAGFGRLALEPPVVLAPPLRVHPRRGGERLEQPGALRELRTLLQDLAVPPWVRARLPLLSAADGTVLAAGDLALAPAFASRLQALGTRLRWRRDAD